MASLLYFLVVALEWSGESQEEHYFAMRLPRRPISARPVFCGPKFADVSTRRLRSPYARSPCGDRRGVGETTVHGMSSFPKDKDTDTARRFRYFFRLQRSLFSQQRRIEAEEV